MRAVLAVFKWVGKAAFSVFKWAVAHPLAAVIVGAGILVLGLWLKEQPWAGATALGALAHSMGTSIAYTALGSFIGLSLAGVVGKWAGAATGLAFAHGATMQRWVGRWIP